MVDVLWCVWFSCNWIFGCKIVCLNLFFGFVWVEEEMCNVFVCGFVLVLWFVFWKENIILCVVIFFVECRFCGCYCYCWNGVIEMWDVVWSLEVFIDSRCCFWFLKVFGRCCYWFWWLFVLVGRLIFWSWVSLLLLVFLVFFWYVYYLKF